MRRRKFLLSSVSVIAAGCTGSPQDEPTTETTEATTETTIETLTKTTTETSTETTTEQTAPSTRLKVWFEVTMEATLTLERLSDGKVVYEETKKYRNKDTVNLTDEFEPDTDYRFTILNANDEQIFDRGIGDYEGYVLSVESENKVEIINHEEI